MPKFGSCFTTKPYRDPQSPLRQTEEGKKAGCVFCDVRKENGFDIVYEDPTLIAFRDRSPQAKEHILIIPRLHVVNSVRQLNDTHVPLLDEMSALARRLYPEHTKAGFHIPPFSSVPHLHLHVFVPPFTALGRLKYPQSGSPDRKSWGWWISDTQVRGALLRGDRIGLGGGGRP